MKVYELSEKDLNSGTLEVATIAEKVKLANGEVKQEQRPFIIDIKKGCYRVHGNFHLLRSGKDKFYKRAYAFTYQNKSVYWLKSDGPVANNIGQYVGFNWIEEQQFLWMQSDHWLQKEQNIRYIINLIFLVLGAYIGFQNIK